MKVNPVIAKTFPASYALRPMAWILPLLLLLSGFSAQAVTFNAEEQKLASLLTSASGQRRDRSQMRADDRLSQVARSRAMDMAKRRYFGHTNPDGVAANYLVRATGYQLPSTYSTSRTANSIESIGAGYANANEAWNAWMGSSAHKNHLLANDTFYRDQTSFGIGFYSDSSSPYRTYWVIITAPPSAPAATLSIATPSANARVTAPSVAMSGQVSGNEVFASLQYRVETPAGSGNWNQLPLPAGHGVGPWNTSVSGLKPGNNTVRVRTLSATGAVAKEMTRSVRLVETRPLTVSVEGGGSVSTGFLGTTSRELGAPFNISAKAKSGHLFSHWTGLPEGANRYAAAQTVVMEEGLALTAHFIADPFVALSANYGGVFADTSQSHGASGALFAKISPGGAFSGAVFFSGKRLSVRGKFDARGDATVTIKRSGAEPLTLTLHIDPTGADQRITGTITDGTVTLDLSTGRSTATEVAQYNVLFSVAEDEASPAGVSYATVKIAASGAAKVTGSLADGTSFSASSYLTGNTIPMYAALYSGKGSVAGSLTIGEDGSVQGSITWHHPARPNTRFALEFHTEHTLSGSRYVAPATTEAALALGENLLQVASPELTEILSLGFTVNAGSKVVFPVKVAGWKLSLNAKTGRFTGSYAHPEGGNRKFSGLIDEAANGGYGYALAPAQSAAVYVGR